MGNHSNHDPLADGGEPTRVSKRFQAWLERMAGMGMRLDDIFKQALEMNTASSGNNTFELSARDRQQCKRKYITSHLSTHSTSVAFRYDHSLFPHWIPTATNSLLCDQ